MPNIKFVVLHSSVYGDRVKNLISTWLSDQDHVFYGDYAKPELNIIKVSDNNAYHSNEEKFINIFNQLDITSHDWIMFVDDDTFINTNLLISRLESFDKNAVHGQHINTWPQDRSLYYLSGGAGILIHKDLYRSHRGSLVNYATGFADVTLGLYLRSKKVKIKGHDYFRSQPPAFYAGEYESEADFIRNTISFHYIRTLEEQRRLYGICSKIQSAAD